MLKTPAGTYLVFAVFCFAIECGLRVVVAKVGDLIEVAVHTNSKKSPLYERCRERQ